MFLPPDPIKLLPFFGISLGSLLLGKKIEGPGGNASLYRNLSNGLNGRVLTSETTISNLLDYMQHFGDPIFGNRKLDSDASEEIENKILMMTNEEQNITSWKMFVDCWGVCGIQLPKMFSRALELEAASYRAMQLASERDIVGLRALIEKIGFSETQTARTTRLEMGKANDISFLLRASRPFVALSLLSLLAALDADLGNARDRPSIGAIIPRWSQEGKVERPMRLWMRLLQDGLGFSRQAEVNKLLWNGVNSPGSLQRDGKKLWSGEPATINIFQIILKNAEMDNHYNSKFLECIGFIAVFVKFVDEIYKASILLEGDCAIFSTKNLFDDYHLLRNSFA